VAASAVPKSILKNVVTTGGHGSAGNYSAVTTSGLTRPLVHSRSMSSSSLRDSLEITQSHFHPATRTAYPLSSGHVSTVVDCVVQLSTLLIFLWRVWLKVVQIVMVWVFE